ncbi:MAG: sigma 54-interacting transcriptional regulator [Vicinamibacteraceae bacterium]|nr:sigma 54-interacting transcriptional regulator [Vicinamibacteraceae bacterium]
MTAAGAAPLADVDVRYRALVDVASALASHAELDDLFRSLRGHIEPLIEFSFVAVSLRNGHDDSLVLRYFEPQSVEAVRLLGTTYPVEGTYPGRAVRTGRVVYVPHVEAGGPYPSAILTEYGIRTYCAVPLVTPRGVIGSLNFGCERSDAYTEGDLDLMTHVAKIVAAAVENALSLETVRRQQTALARERDQLDLLLEVTNAVVTQLDTRALFRAVAPALRRCCSADFAALTLYDPEARVLRKHACDAGGRDAPELIPRAVEHSLDRSPSGLVFREGRPRLFTRDELVSFPEHAFFIDHGIHSACSVPLATAQGVLGTLDMAACAPDAFSPAQFGLITRVAGQIAIAVQNAVSYERIEQLNAQLGREKLYLEDEIWSEHRFEDIIGRSPALRRVLREVETVAPTESTVLITGETGSGKELVARAIHRLSERADQTFVRLNCAAIPTGLLESELFGHEKGAFTGAISQRIGRFELAHRGTVFLDEIGEIPLELQPKLLRVLQEREFERLGSARTLRTDARLIAATNRDLGALVAEQQFREDLYYRLNVFPIEVPPLRERREDIPMLVRHFAQQFARRMKKSIETIPADAMDALVAYDWPGNIRELQNLVERAVILSSGPTLDVPAIASMPRGRTTLPVESGESLEAMERRHVLAALEGANWVIGGPNGAAQRLGLKRSTLQFRMRKLGITRPAPAR